MAPVLRAALVLCVMLAAVPHALTQDQLTCERDEQTCDSMLTRAGRNQNSVSEMCRAFEDYFSCITSITSCGDIAQDTVQHAVDAARARLRKDGCTAQLTHIPDMDTCDREINDCASTLKSALRYQNTHSDFCRAFENAFTCDSRITSCGSLYQVFIQAAIERSRVHLRDLGCGAEGTAVVSVVTLLLSLGAALVWGQS